jgi:hypothetical protein
MTINLSSCITAFNVKQLRGAVSTATPRFGLKTLEKQTSSISHLRMIGQSRVSFYKAIGK